MRKKILVVLVLLAAPIAMAASITGSGLNEGALGSLYCALAGCEMTGALSSDSAIVTELGGSNGGILISDSVTGSGVSNDTAANYGSQTIEASRKFEIKTGQNTVTSCIANGDGGAYWDACTVGADCCSGLCNKDGNTKCAGNSNSLALILLETIATSTITLDSGGGDDELVVGNGAVTMTGDLDVTGTGRIEDASTATCTTDAHDGVMYYRHIAAGSGLCICMFDGTTYELKATITLGTFTHTDC